MNIKQMVQIAAIAAVTLTLSGCASTGGVVSSLEDLSTESVKEGLIKIPQYRVASIPGWLPFADVGGLYFYKPSRKPSSVIGLSPGKSFELISEIPSSCDETGLATIRAELTNLGTLTQQLVQSRIDLSTSQANKDASIKEAETNYKAAQNAFNTKYEAVVNALKDNGVFIYRWSSDSKQSGHIGLDSILGVAGQKDQKHNGFALVSGLRTKTLFVGTDILKAWDKLDTKSRFSNRFEITTHIMQAKHIMYGNMLDVDTHAKAKLEASYQQLANAANTLKSLTQIEIEGALSKISSLSNVGVMGKMKRKAESIDWTEDGLKKRLEDDNWLTFFSVESDFPNILELLQEKPAQP